MVRRQRIDADGSVQSAKGESSTATRARRRSQRPQRRCYGFALRCLGATNQIQSGSDVEVDPVNTLFFVAQSASSTGSGSSIEV